MNPVMRLISVASAIDPPVRITEASEVFDAACAARAGGWGLGGSRRGAGRGGGGIRRDGARPGMGCAAG
ncbi:hypothetical protein GOARA_087_00060 [Gordonia araii NBRC 100433]|uniref:Uncharacterized protein n=1 Tax=Gordonia araii NBRC 100433 TaxID=1073574 RepID=G7H788_9ACTN|nr:hypothetical protein GOARA_087_00060 [Gordonia araii NBRC 100433]